MSVQPILSSSCITLSYLYIAARLRPAPHRAAPGRDHEERRDGRDPGQAGRRSDTASHRASTRPWRRRRSGRPALVAARRDLPGLRRGASPTATATGPATSPASAPRLPYLRDLGVDAIWFTPWYVSPLADGGYDVADYRAIDPAFGTLAEAEALIAEALEFGIRTIVDVVPNHVSDSHPWFQAALAAGPGSPERDRVLVPSRPRRRTATSCRPTGGRSSRARTWTPDDEPGRDARRLVPPPVHGRAAGPQLGPSRRPRPSTRRSSRFWFDRGAAGVRIDSAALLVKDPAMPEVPDDAGCRAATRPTTATSSTTIYRGWRAVADRYAGDAGAGRRDLAAGRRAVRPLPPAGRAPHRLQLRLHGPAVGRGEPARVDRRDARRARAGRRAGDLGALEPRRHPAGHALRPRGLVIRVRPQAVRDPHATSPLGRRRARAAALLTAALPGSLYIYQGDELGLDEVEVLRRRDPGPDARPIRRRSTRAATAAACRCPGAATTGPFGFSPDGRVGRAVADASRPTGPG